VVIPYTILGQVLARTGGAEFFSDLAMSAMWRFRGGAAKIALRLTVPRPLEATVGDQISGRQVKRLQLQCLTSVAGAGDFRAYLHAARVITSGVK